MKLKKLTKMELTEGLAKQQGSLQGLLGLFNAYIEFKEDGEEFKSFVEERMKKTK